MVDLRKQVEEFVVVRIQEGFSKQLINEVYYY